MYKNGDKKIQSHIYFYKIEGQNSLQFVKRNLKQLEIEKSFIFAKSGTYLKRFQISANLQLSAIPRDGNLSPYSHFSGWMHSTINLNKAPH